MARTAVPGPILHLGPYDIDGLPGPRLVRVGLPPGYDKSNAWYPLLMMWDGQNIFDDAPSFAGGWRVHEAVAKRVRRRKEVPIVVGVDRGGASRMVELSPWTQAGQGKLDRLLDWIKNTLMPELTTRFRIKLGPEFTTVGGSSLGGLASVYAHFRHPEVFGGVLAMSPSLFVGRGAIYNFVESTSRPWKSRIYLDAGGMEARGRLLTAGERMANVLWSKGYDGHALMWRPVKSGLHNERHWRGRFPKALRFLYG